MKKPWRILLSLAAMNLVFLLWTGRKEPEYHSKRLSQWMTQSSEANDRKKAFEAEEALRAIGTNAIPFLLERRQYQPGVWRMRMDAVRLQLSYRVCSSKSISRAFNDWKQSRAEYAPHCFQTLGDSAASTASELTGLAKSASLTYECSSRALYASSGSGSNGWPGLISIATDTNLESRRRITAMNRLPLNISGANAGLILKGLISCVGDKDPLVVAAAANVLGLMHMFPELSVPALMKTYDSPLASVRIRAVSALAQFGASAIIATYVLTKALADPDTGIQTAARSSLQRVTGSPSNNLVLLIALFGEEDYSPSINFSRNANRTNSGTFRSPSRPISFPR